MVRREEIEKLAQLSRIEVSDEEIEDLTRDIESILEYVSELTQIAVDEPVPKAGTLRNVMREDKEPHERGLYTKKLIDAAPEHEDQCVKVKKILQ